MGSVAVSASVRYRRSLASSARSRSFQPRLRRVGRDLGPDVERVVEQVERDHFLCLHRLVESIPDDALCGVGELRPEVLADQRRRGPAQDLRRALVDVGESPLLVERVDGVGHPVQHVVEFGAQVVAPSHQPLSPCGVPGDVHAPDDDPAVVAARIRTRVDGGGQPNVTAARRREPNVATGHRLARPDGPRQRPRRRLHGGARLDAQLLRTVVDAEDGARRVDDGDGHPGCVVDAVDRSPPHPPAGAYLLAPQGAAFGERRQLVERGAARTVHLGRDVAGGERRRRLVQPPEDTQHVRGRNSRRRSRSPHTPTCPPKHIRYRRQRNG